MPKSKRAKLISLTKTDQKGKDGKKAHAQEVRDCCEEYKSVYTFSVENMRNSKLKEVRTAWKDSRFFFGKNKVMAKAFGWAAEDEYKPGMHNISLHLKGNVGVLFTNRDHDDVVRWFDNYSESEFARSGNKATKDVHFPAGPLTQFSHTMEPQLRGLGMPTSLKRGIVTLDQDFQVCKEDQVLTPEMARILKLFEIKMVAFGIKLLTKWEDNTFSEL